MYLYLVQHGIPVGEDVDPKRPLSDRGIEDVTKMAEFLKDVRVNAVYHSGKDRARQTAEILAKTSGVSPQEEKDLKPMDDPRVWEKRLKKMNEDTMLVGHLPFMGYLASLLLTGDQDSLIVAFKQGAMVCLRRESSVWTLQWMVMPELVE
jgi:phosphohistidine phosphatase